MREGGLGIRAEVVLLVRVFLLALGCFPCDLRLHQFVDVKVQFLDLTPGDDLTDILPKHRLDSPTKHRQHPPLETFPTTQQATHDNLPAKVQERLLHLGIGLLNEPFHFQEKKLQETDSFPFGVVEGWA